VVTEWHQIHDDLFASQYPGILVPALKMLERATARIHRETLVRAGTEEWQRDFPRIGFRPRNVFVVPVSIREDWLGDEMASTVSEASITWLGKFRRYKCPHHIVEAMPRVLERIPRARLTLVGRRDDRNYEQRLERLAHSLGVGHAVGFRFDVTDTEKREILLRSRCLVVPSPVEGFGVVVLESNACGVPVVASSGVPTGAVTDGYNGIRYPFADIDALGDALVRVICDDSLYSRLSTNAQEFSRRFAWHRVGESYERIIRQAVSRQ